jgi:hypothetical protein
VTEQRRNNILFGIVTLAPFVAFAVIEFAPWWVSTPFTILAFLWWFGALLLLKRRGESGE